MEATKTHPLGAVTTLVAASTLVGPILAGVGSTRAAAATPGSNAFDRFHAEATNRHASASSSPGELGREELDAFGVVFGA